MTPFPRVRRPCDECPTRLDAPVGRFAARRFQALLATVGRPGAEQPLGAPLFACHKTPEGAERTCAGWLVLCGPDHMTVRWAISDGRLPADALKVGADWPPLYETYDEMAAANGVPKGGSSMRRDEPVVSPSDDRLLTPAEVAALFRVDPKTVTRWAAAGRISAIRTPGGHRRFRESEVKALLDEGHADGDE